ncbi:hypothetical protein, partial [Bacillus safensis]|uniref:hypothetical protein n=1 Tax=Bacillus safensis TaxID=561879 RepID=UPI003396F451
SEFEMHVDQFQDILGEVGKSIELDKGFMMKIGERGGHSFMICCLSNIQTPKLTLLKELITGTDTNI